MAGHSQFKNIMHRKGIQDKKRGKVFTKIAHEIVIAVKDGGNDPIMNTRLKNALQIAKQNNMPKDNIERAIKKATGGNNNEAYSEIRYEATYKDGIAIIIESLTDNKNRSASEIRTILSKNGATLVTTGSISFMFDKVGYIEYDATNISEDDMFAETINAGAMDFAKEDDKFVITTKMEDFGMIKDLLIEKFSEPMNAELIWQAKDLINVSHDSPIYAGLEKLIGLLEDNDDVQSVWINV